MKFIAHRGNTNGRDFKNENTPDYLKLALKNYAIETDVRIKNGQLWLGHDYCETLVPAELLLEPNIYWHAKSLETYFKLRDNGYKTFIHDADPMAIVANSGEIWVHPNNILEIKNRYDAIAVMPEKAFPLDVPSSEAWNFCWNNFNGVCSDNVALIREFHNRGMGTTI